MIKNNNGTKIIAEIAQSHLGSISLAKKMITLSAKAGADYVKFQAHYAKYESTLDEKFRKGYKFKEKNRLEYWKKFEFNKKQWSDLINHSKKYKIKFLCSPFSIYSFKLLRSLGLRKWKIGSGEFFSEDLINAILAKKDSIILSTGLAKMTEITKKINLLKKKKINFVLLQCTTQYPSSLKTVGLNVVHEFRRKYRCQVGLSDHTGLIDPGLYAINNCFDYLEVHVDFKNSSGPDSSSSINFDQLKILCDYRNNLKILRKNKINKNTQTIKISSIKDNFTKSICLNKSLKKGNEIKMSDIIFKKPGNGIKFKDLNKVVGSVLRKNLDHNRILKWSDFE